MNETNRVPKDEFVEKFRQRTKKLALDVIRFSQTLPKTEESGVTTKNHIEGLMKEASEILFVLAKARKNTTK